MESRIKRLQRGAAYAHYAYLLAFTTALGKRAEPTVPQNVREYLDFHLAPKALAENGKRMDAKDNGNERRHGKESRDKQ